MNEQLLEEIGLTKGEIKVYLTLLRIGESTTGSIIKNAQISSGKIYEILDKLITKGLASYIVKEKTKYFTAASPKRILDYLNEKENELLKKEQQIKQELPALLAIEKEKKKTYETTLYTGLRGMQTAIYECIKDMTEKDEVLAMGVTAKKDPMYNRMWLKWHKLREQRKIPCKIIMSEKGTDYYSRYEKMKYCVPRMLAGITPSSINIFKDIVIILNYEKNPSCVFIRNPEVTESFTTFFYNLWEKAEE